MIVYKQWEDIDENLINIERIESFSCILAIGLLL